jgi:DNA-directed RNA polymerase specialized sigma24 family protein
MYGHGSQMPARSTSTASKEQVVSAVKGIEDADLVRLKRIAQMRAIGLQGMEWRDLLNEAIARAIGGSRLWPLEVPFIAFLAQTMRSIANEQWRRIHESPVQLESDLPLQSSNGPSSAIDSFAIDQIDPQRHALANSALREVLKLFGNDKVALEILGGIGDGMSPKEIQKQLNLTETDYDSARKRIRRSLAKAFSEGKL